ncbi:MAG: tRNA 2-thiouridine(34) synthase MnmA [Bdellovibrionota bacterium]
MSRVVVGMSGGVDSSVTAALLKEQGHDVIGLFMKNWEELDADGVCSSAQDFEDVVRVCEKLDVPYFSVEFIKEYRDNVFRQFLEQYEAGYTPNPDILCNKEIKFDVFMKRAMELGADYFATGHYARVLRSDGGGVMLGRGVDTGKDQSYFLHAVNSEALSKVLFPVGELQKSEVREIARRYDLATKDKKDSTGICFIGERDFREFLSRYVPAKPGAFRNLAGERVGEHVGSAFYTLGQRKGLGLGGQGEPWFVVAKDQNSNTVYVERGTEHSALYSRELWAKNPTWISSDPCAETGTFEGTAKVRYRQQDQVCQVSKTEDGCYLVRFKDEQRAVTPGQFVVFYNGDACLGGAVIDRVGPTLWERNRS